MRPFVATWRTLVSFYNDLFLLMGMSGLWWITGGFMAGAAAVLTWAVLQAGGPVWLLPLLAIPAGPASAALANVTRQSARDLAADRSFFFDGLRTYWRQALGLSAASMAVLSLLLLNLLFYASQSNSWLRALGLLWLYLLLVWLVVQIYLYPALVALKEPTVWGALRMATVLAFANPLYTFVLLLIAAVLTGLNILLAILVVIAWPALMALLGEHSVKLLIEQVEQKARQSKGRNPAPPGSGGMGRE